MWWFTKTVRLVWLSSVFKYTNIYEHVNKETDYQINYENH